MLNNNEPVKEKKKAGRPPKKEKTDHLVAVLGIVDSPECEDNIVEIFLTKPVIFKKLLSLYDDYDASIVRIDYTKTKMTISYYGGDKKIISTIEGKYCNKYYCQEDIHMYVESESLLKLVNFVEPEYDYEFIWNVTPEIVNRNKIYLRIKNKSSNEDEEIEISEVDPFNKAIGPIFNDEEDHWPIAGLIIAKSYKRKFTGISKSFNSECKLINDPVAKKLILSSQDRGRKTTYGLKLNSIANHPGCLDSGDNLMVVFINVFPLRLFLKNCGDENCKMIVSEDGVVCMSTEIGKVKNKGTMIGTTKLYSWTKPENVSQYVPENDADYVREPARNKPKKKKDSEEDSAESEDDFWQGG